MLLGFCFHHAALTIAGYQSWQDGINPDIILAQFNGQGFCQPHNAPFGRRIGGAKCKAIFASSRRQIHNRGIIALPQIIKGCFYTVKLSVQTDIYTVLPGGIVNIFYFCGRASNPGIIDQTIQAAQFFSCFVNNLLDGGTVRDIAKIAMQAGMFFGQRGQRGLLHITGCYLRPFF